MKPELIEVFATHADFYVGNEHYDKTPEERELLWFEKYTELVVQECMALCLTSVGNGDYNRGRMDCHDNMREHFGVEK